MLVRGTQSGVTCGVGIIGKVVSRVRGTSCTGHTSVIRHVLVRGTPSGVTPHWGKRAIALALNAAVVAGVALVASNIYRLSHRSRDGFLRCFV